ncbi:MAG TPA: CpsD/CapB family tyrosine-protein kinase [Terriglobales bacterium]|nr:CpsD/CapB family tyrosine-protein kinase [Terriglobales bacterium]
MSRIHDALKRAEQERQSQGSGVVATEVSHTTTPLDVLDSSPDLAQAYVAPEGHAEDGVLTPPPKELSLESLNSASRQEWSPDPKKMVFSGDDHENYSAIEEFRTLRSRLYQLREKRNFKSILVSSALPAEGKTFVSANLAQVLARHRSKSVLLVDADLRKPALHHCLGATAVPGLSEYLRGEKDEAAIIHRGQADNLFFIPCGNPTATPGELISNGRLQALLAQVSQVFDWVIVDSPPAVPVSDAARIASWCDGVLLVVQSGSTPYDMAQRARRDFRSAPILGAVLNRVPPGSTYTSYYYYNQSERHADVGKES